MAKSSATTSSFITLDTINRKASWFSASNANVGTYTISITGTIRAASDWSSTTSFSLTITGTCIGATENIVIIPTNSTITTMTYAVGNTPSSWNFSTFSVSGSTYCTEANLLYQVSVVPTAPDKSIVFITTNMTGVSWSTSSSQ